MTKLERYMAVGQAAGCPRNQMDNFIRAGVILQERQLAASAAAKATGFWGKWALTTVSACRI